MPCVSLRDDATRQLRVPIAAAACQCDEDWHSGKLSLKIFFFRSLSIKQSGLHTKMPRARSADVVRTVEGVLVGKQRQGSGKNKNLSAGKKNMSAFWGQRRIVEKQGRELEARPLLYPDSCSARGGIGSCPRLID